MGPCLEEKLRRPGVNRPRSLSSWAPAGRRSGARLVAFVIPDEADGRVARNSLRERWRGLSEVAMIL
jgi:hypothetical protein